MMLGKLIKLRLKGMLFRQRGAKKKRTGPLTVVLIALLFVYVAVAMGFLFYTMFHALAQSVYGTELQWYYFALVGLMTFALGFIGTVFSAKSELFEAKDNEFLLSMPIRPRVILMSRVAILLIMEYAFSALALIPAAIAWFSAAPVTASVLVPYIITALVLPLLGASLACLVGWLLALLTVRVRNKSLITMIFSLLFLGVYFFFYANAGKYFTVFIDQSADIAKGISAWAAIFYWYGTGIAQGNLLGVVGFCAVCLAVFTLMLALLSRGFHRVTTTKYSAVRRRGKAATYLSINPSSALFRRELKHFASSPPYMMNCTLGVLISVVAAVALLIKQKDAYAFVLTLGSGLSISSQTLQIGVALILCFLTVMNIITAPSISIEGKTVTVLRALPVRTMDVLKSKLRLHMTICTLPTLFLSVAAAVVVRAGAAQWIAILLLPQTMTLLSGLFGLMMNLILPKLDWINETVAVKQSMSTLVTMLGLMAYVIAAFLGLIFAQGISPALYAFLVCGVNTVLCVLIFLWLRRGGVRRFETLC